MTIRSIWISRLSVKFDVDSANFRIRFYSQFVKVPEQAENKDGQDNCPDKNAEQTDDMPSKLVKWRVKTCSVFPARQILNKYFYFL